MKRSGIVLARLFAAAIGLASLVPLTGRAQSHPPLRQAPAPSMRPLSEGNHYFIDDAKGDDAAAGSAQMPWKTIARGLVQLRAGDTLVLRGGVYYERLYVALAGEQDRPITIRSYPGEQAIIDGSFREFTERPSDSWQPASGGANDEFASQQSYPNERDVVGSFGDSLIGLQTYYHAQDLRAASELVDWEDWNRQAETDIKPLYCGPGLWLNRQTGRIHCRLAHTHLPQPVANYQGSIDPRQVPLVIAAFDAVPLTLDGCQHVRLADLVIRGAGYTSIVVQQCRHVEIDNCTVWCGTYGLRISGTEDFRLTSSRLYGSVAPWTFRSDASKRDYPGRPHRNISRLNTHALIEIDSGRESSVFATPQNDRWEIAHCHFADAHDGVYLGAINVRFHDNTIENLQDDGVYLSPMYMRHRLDKTDPQIHIIANTFRQLLTPLAFGGDRPETGDQVFIARNLFDMRAAVLTGRPSTKNAAAGTSSGKPLGDHGSPPWAAMNIYHNTFVMAEPARDVAMNALASNGAGHPRRVFNNLFIHLDRLPAFIPPQSEHNVISDGNWYWSPRAEPAQLDALFTRFRKSEQFTKSQAQYPPGWETKSRTGDPRVKADSFIPEAGSPLLDAGVAIPPDWPDPLRDKDRGTPDIGR
ncbi:MAG: right-handed parallel beta-helix repeat-containing protein [Planctomycetaceae bacterium]|nr:right-handed parallel beta-helix repeat-containing protein [Planctomycetaceae bacterium]